MRKGSCRISLSRHTAWTRSTSIVCLAGLLLVATTSCGKAQPDATAVRVGSHPIAVATVRHWMSVLAGKGSNLHEPGPQVPVPPEYKACIALQRTGQPSSATSEAPPTARQLKAFCDFEYRRFRLKALYLLISYQWVTGEAAELGVKVDKNELHRQLTTYEHALAPSQAAFRQVLRYWRAKLADILLSLELAQLTTKIETKVQGNGHDSPQQAQAALVAFGRSYKRRWLARTSCKPPYIVPICRQYRRPEAPPDLIPPGVPLTSLPAGS